jgi:hypothetical protein
VNLSASDQARENVNLNFILNPGITAIMVMIMIMTMLPALMSVLAAANSFGSE